MCLISTYNPSIYDSKAASVWKSAVHCNPLYVWERSSLTPVQVQPFVFPPGSCIPWRHQRERRHTGHIATQTWRNPTKMSRDVGVGQVRNPPHPPLASSSPLWRTVRTHAACGCVLLCDSCVWIFFFFFWDAQPQNRLFFSGRHFTTAAVLLHLKNQGRADERTGVYTLMK